MKRIIILICLLKLPFALTAQLCNYSTHKIRFKDSLYLVVKKDSGYYGKDFLLHFVYNLNTAKQVPNPGFTYDLGTLYSFSPIPFKTAFKKTWRLGESKLPEDISVYDVKGFEELIKKDDKWVKDSPKGVQRISSSQLRYDTINRRVFLINIFGIAYVHEDSVSQGAKLVYDGFPGLGLVSLHGGMTSPFQVFRFRVGNDAYLKLFNLNKADFDEESGISNLYDQIKTKASEDGSKLLIYGATKNRLTNNQLRSEEMYYFINLKTGKIEGKSKENILLNWPNEEESIELAGKYLFYTVKSGMFNKCWFNLNIINLITGEEKRILL